MKKTIKVVDVSGVSFDGADMTKLVTEEDVIAEAARIFGRILSADAVTFSPKARAVLIKSWKQSKHLLQ